jgi:hypothetical protein
MKPYAAYLNRRAKCCLFNQVWWLNPLSAARRNGAPCISEARKYMAKPMPKPLANLTGARATGG